MSNTTCSTDECERPIKYKGLCSRCYAKAWRIANVEKVREQERQRAVRAREAHSGTFNERLRMAYADDPDKYKQRVREHRAANLQRVRERERAKSARFREDNPEEMRAMVRAATKNWRKANPLKVREQCRARRAKTPAGTVDYAAILERYGMVCHICSDAIPSMADLHMDHVIPLARGGEHAADNIKPSHAFCNLQKGARV